MTDEKMKCVHRRTIYRNTCTKIANEMKDLMKEGETLDKERLHRILSLKHSLTDKLQEIKDLDKIILTLEQNSDEYKKEIHQILNYHEQFYDLYVEIEVLTGSGKKSTGEYNQLSCKYPTQKILQQKKEEYIQSFTIHGLTKILTGTSFESIFWACIVLIGMCVSNVVMYQLLTKYYRYEVATDVSETITNKNFFPSITFCDPKMYRTNYYAYCGVPRGSKHDSPDQPCRKPIRNRTELVSHLNGHEWSNGYFHVKYCRTNGGKYCTNHKYLKSLSRFNNTCFTFNWNGDLYDGKFGRMYITFEMNKTANVRYSKTIRAYIHDPKVLKPDNTNSVIMKPSNRYHVKITKTILKRLPHPYRSNCTTGKEGNIFRGKYTRLNCIFSMKYIGLLKQCGDIFDYHKRIIPTHILKQYRKENQSINAFLRCMEDYDYWIAGSKTEKCSVSCEEVELSTTHTVTEVKYDDEVNKTVYRVGVQMNNVDSYKVYTERPIYSWDGIVGQVGGVLGLLTGTSFISIIELIVYTMLCLLHKVVKRKKRDDGLMGGSLEREETSMV